jgi:hypothetical protein
MAIPFQLLLEALTRSGIRRAALDQGYMQQWARELKVDDLLERLFSEEYPA